jgi:hypothetical protein
MIDLESGPTEGYFQSEGYGAPCGLVPEGCVGGNEGFPRGCDEGEFF